MDMTNSVVIAAPQLRLWEALNDPETLKRCIAGCESIEKTGDNAYRVAMTVAIGPVKAKFKGDLALEDIEAPNAYTIRFSGQGGMAGFGKGSAKVKLTPEGNGTRLDYTVDAQVGGKIAQVGSRLIDGASKKMADDFFNAFRREVELPESVVSAPVVQAAPVATTPTAAPAAAATTQSGDGHDAMPTAAEATERLVAQALSNEKWTWLAIAVAVAASALLLKR